jgi:omega-6 fatty acid desaturase (delta-12 desaturase)
VGLRAAALQGSSFCRVPRILPWFSGNISVRHINPLSPRDPNYTLQRCYDAEPLFRPGAAAAKAIPGSP